MNVIFGTSRVGNRPVGPLTDVKVAWQPHAPAPDATFIHDEKTLALFPGSIAVLKVRNVHWAGRTVRGGEVFILGDGDDMTLYITFK